MHYRFVAVAQLRPDDLLSTSQLHNAKLLWTDGLKDYGTI